MSDILQAARSYYGLADIESCTTQLFTNQAGQTCVAFEIPLSPEDFIAIGERMKAMQEAESQQVEQAPVFGEDLDTHAMRQQYNALSKAERGKYGSFGKYLTAMSNGIIDVSRTEEQRVPKQFTLCDENGPTNKKIPADVSRKKWNELTDEMRGSFGSYENFYRAYTVPVVKPDCESEEPTTMDAVWLNQSDTNHVQREYAVDVRPSVGYLTENQYLVQWSMLSDEQRQKATQDYLVAHTLKKYREKVQDEPEFLHGSGHASVNKGEKEQGNE